MRTLFILLIILLASTTLALEPETVSKYVFFIGELSERADLESLKNEVLFAKEMFKGHCLNWNELLNDYKVELYLTESRFWLCVPIQDVEEAEEFLSAMLQGFAEKYDIMLSEKRWITSKISITIENEDGTLDIACMLVVKASPSEYYEFIPMDELINEYNVEQEDIELKLEEDKLIWIIKTSGETKKIDAIYFKNKKKTSSIFPGLFFFGVILPRRRRWFCAILGLLLPLSSIFAADYVIMYKSSISGWQAITDLHSEYSGNYQDLTYTSLISEKLSDLQSIKPSYVIIVIQASDGDPDFFDDVDSTMSKIDTDEFEDAIWTIIVGYDASLADALVTASDATSDKTLVIANPDGSLRGAGYSGYFMTNFITNDNTYLGNENHYVNTTSSNDVDATASNLQTEINNDNKDCVLFLDHGSTNCWALRDWGGPRAGDYFVGWFSDLRTWYDSDANGSLDSYYIINNGKNSFIYAEACLTTRINGNRTSNWSPWESSGNNVSGSSSSSIALAWMEDSPGFYIGSNTVSYGEAHIKFVGLNTAKFGYKPAQSMLISKNIYHYIIGDETLDTNPSNGTADDYLLFLEREYLGIGDPSWDITISHSTSPNYTISYPNNTQQNQLPTNARGYVYADNLVKWQCACSLSFNEEIRHEPWGSADEDSTPFTFIFVEEVGGNGSSVWCNDYCAVLGGIFKPAVDAESIQYVGSDPSDQTWKLYQHPWYGIGVSNAYEIFKCRINTNEVVWVLGAGITDDDSDGNIEWDIDNGYTKSFNVYYWLPEVQQTTGAEQVVTTNNRQRTISFYNKSSQTTDSIIARVPAPDDVYNESVSPTGEVSNVHDTTIANQKYVEFTSTSINAGVTENYTLSYNVTANTPSSWVMDTSTTDWFTSTELIDTRNSDELYMTWDHDELYTGYKGANWNTDGDLFVYIDSKSGGASKSYNWAGYGTHNFPSGFSADYVLCVENPGAYSLKKYVSGTWQDASYSGSALFSSDTSEICIPFSDIGYDDTTRIFRYMVFCQNEGASTIWNAFPPENPLGTDLTNYYQYTNGLRSGVAPNAADISLFVQLSSFTAESKDRMVILKWRTESELENREWQIKRSLNQESEYELIAMIIDTIGTSTYPIDWEYTDKNLKNGTTYWYKLLAIDINGVESCFGPISGIPEGPGFYALSQSFPNPFSIDAKICYQLPEDGFVILKIYDITGKVVCMLVNDEKESGYYSVYWDGKDDKGKSVSTGLYFYQIKVGNSFNSRKKMLFLK
ncbi:hypothetical protein KAX35_07330 [candidate division WOR-3 bacterium]|nr:hypothetical protein [candidate division WOR-3 bacterium]